MLILDDLLTDRLDFKFFIHSHGKNCKDKRLLEYFVLLSS